MQGWLGVVVQILGVLIGLMLVSLLMLAVRRRWLDRVGATFDCSLRLRMTTPGAGWVLGVGRYSEGILEWFREWCSPDGTYASWRRGCRILSRRWH